MPSSIIASSVAPLARVTSRATRPRPRGATALLAAALLHGAMTLPALAHAFWIQAPTLRPKLDEVTKLEFRVGDEMPGETRPREESRVVRFVAFEPGQEASRDVPGIDGRPEAGLMRFSTPGIWVVAYESTPSKIELPAEKFEAYLKEEGLDKIVQRRELLGESKDAGTELYSRCAKSLIHAGGASSAGFDRIVGLPLEIVPMSDPGAIMMPGATDSATKASHASTPDGRTPTDHATPAPKHPKLRVRVIFDGEALENAMVHVHAAADPAHHQTVRTNRDGIAEVSIQSSGLWVLDTVEMVDAPKDSGARWRSYWASLSFEVK
jgi:hypothetical protein